MSAPRQAELKSVWTRFATPVDGASLAVFRILFGLLMFGGAIRFLWNGWVERFFLQPDFFFHY